MRKSILLQIMICVIAGCAGFFYSSTVHSYSFFDSSIVTEDPILSNICGVKDGEVSCKKFSTKQRFLDKKLSKFFIILEKLPKYKKTLLLNQIKNAIPYIDTLVKKQINGGENEKIFTMVYVKIIFEDIVAYYSYQESLIKISRENILGNIKSHADMRREIIRELIEREWDNFIERPYIGDSISISTSNENRQSYDVSIDVSIRDDLDIFLQGEATGERSEIILSPSKYQQWGKIALFKNLQDLQYLGYDVVSHRKRISNDLSYRRYNIAKAFDLLGHVRVINPGETVSFLEESQFDPNDQEYYLKGKVIMGDEEVDAYGGGLCGGSTALFQGVVLNNGLEIEAKNHSKRYSNLYTATINGQNVTIPGLDSTIYYPYLDLKITNITTYPIVLVSNFTGELGVEEEVFTLGKKSDTGSIEYLSSYPKSYTFKIKDTGEEKTELEKVETEEGVEGENDEISEEVVEEEKVRVTNGRCYRRRINGEESTKCYKEVF